jgi:sugar phosphate isomerase/epimerase
MKLPLHHCIRPGIVHFMAFPTTMKGEGPILETYREILGDSYFEVIEIGWIKDATVRKQARALLESAGIEVKYAAQPRLLTQKLDLNSADAGMRARAIAEVEAGIDEAVELGARDVALLSGGNVEAAERCAAMGRLVDSLDQICTYGAEREVQIALEVFDCDIDKKCLVGPANLARELAERVKKQHANFGLLVDLSHIVLLSETPEQALRPVREHLVHVHIGNAYFGSNRNDPYWGDQHPSFGYPGGANDVPEIAAFLKVLLEIGYLTTDGSRRGTVSFEIKPVGDIEPRIMIANAKRKLNAAWALLTP